MELSVSDTGGGIPVAELSHIFERFHRVRGTQSRTHEGTGIGLSLVQELARIHGGEIQVRSVEGRGATFTVTILTGHAHLPKEQLGGTRLPMSGRLGAKPFVEEALRWLPDGTPSSASSVPGSPGLTSPAVTSRDRPQSSRILFANDNADMRDYVRRLLAEILVDPPDLVLADVMMVGCSVDVTERVRAEERIRELGAIVESSEDAILGKTLGGIITSWNKGAERKGLLGIRERVALVGGEFDCKSILGGGTEVHAFFPLRSRPNDEDSRL